MQELKIPVKAQIGEVLGVPQGTRGVFWACNVFPLKDGGISLWRPRLLGQSEETDYAVVYDPSDEECLDVHCVQNGVMFLIKNNTDNRCYLKWWKPPNNIVELSFSFPVPDDGTTGQVKMCGANCVVAIDGHGLYIVEYDESSDSFDNMYRIGALLVGVGGTGDDVMEFDLSSGGMKRIMEVSTGDPIYISDIELFMMAKDYNDYGTIVCVITDDSDSVLKTSVETYSNYSVPVDMAGVDRMWTPLKFTFNQEFTPPFRIHVKCSSGAVNLMLEGAHTILFKEGYNITLDTSRPHIHVGGTLNPDGGVVGVGRGSIFGVKNGLFVQRASIHDYGFYDEFEIDYPVRDIRSYNEGLILFTRKGIYSVDSWSYSGVSMRKVLGVGVNSHHQVNETINGIVAFANNKLVFLGSGGGVKVLPFVYQTDWVEYVSVAQSLNLIIIGFEESKYHLVYSPETDWFCWYRFDEVGTPSIIGSCGDLMLCSDGKCYLMACAEPSDAAGYQVEVALSTGLISVDKVYRIHSIGIDCGIMVKDSDTAFVYVNSSLGDTLYQEKFSIPVMSVDVFTDYPEWLINSGSGIMGYVPDDSNKPLLTYIQDLTVPMSKVITLDVAEQDTVAFPTGKGFVIGIELQAGVPKHPAVILRNFILYTDIVGGYLNG